MNLKEQIKARRAELEKLVTDAKAKHEANLKAAAEGKLTAEDANALVKMAEDAQAKRRDLDALLTLDENDTFLHAPAGEGAKSQQIAPARPIRTWGADVLDNPAYKALQARGGIPHERDFPQLQVGGFKDWIGAAGRQRKAIYSYTDTAGGDLRIPDYDPTILDIARQVAPSVIDLVLRTTTQSDLVQYFEMDTRTENAAVVSERTATNGTVGDDVFGLKPESNRTFNYRTTAVQTIAAWIGVSRQILNDQPQLRQLIDTELVYEVEKKLEATLIAGILAWSGIQTRVHATSGLRFDAADTIADTLRRSLTDIYLAGYSPDAIVLHPAQGEAMELAKDDNNQYLKLYDSATMRIWRVRVLETVAMTAGTGVVAEWGIGVKLWDREQTQVLTGQPNDYMLRNAWAILAELRAAYAVVRPLAVEKITGL